MLERDAVEEFHGDERFAVLVVGFVDRADVGMIQSGSRLRFALEAAERLWVFGNLIGQELQSDKPV